MDPDVPDVPDVSAFMQFAEVSIKLLVLGFGLFTVGLVAVWFFASAVVARYGRRKGRTWGSVFWVGLLIGPIFSGAIVAFISETVHPDEKVVCPKCSSKIRHTSRACAWCNQPLTPNAQIGADVVFRTMKVSERLRLAALVVTGAGALGVLITMFLSDVAFAATLPFVSFLWGVLGVGVGLLLVNEVRKGMVAELSNELLGDA